MGGAIAGRPSTMAEFAAVARTPAERIAHRYLRRCAGVEVTELLDLLGVRTLTVLPGNLEEDGEVLQARVGVEDAQPVETDSLIHLVEHGVERGSLCHVDAGDVEVARVEAEAEALVPSERVEEHRELVDRTADRSAGPRRVLHQEPRALVAA